MSKKPEDLAQALGAGMAAEDRLKAVFVSTRGGNPSKNFSGPGSRMAGDVFAQTGLETDIGKLGGQGNYFREWTARAAVGPGAARPEATA